MAVAAQAEEDHALLPALARRLGLLDDRADGVRGLGRRDDPLGTGEAQRRLEGLVLAEGARLDHPRLDQRAQRRRVAVVAQAAGVHRRRHEAVAERVHRHERREARRVAEVVGVDALGQRRAGRRLGGEEARAGAGAQLAPQPRVGQAGEVRAAAHAADDHVGRVAGELHLGDALLADHGLVQEHVVEHGAQRVVGVLVLGGDLDRLGDRDAQRARRASRRWRGPTRSPRWASGARSRPTSASSSAGRASGRRRSRP